MLLGVILFDKIDRRRRTCVFSLRVHVFSPARRAAPRRCETLFGKENRRPAPSLLQNVEKYSKTMGCGPPSAIVRTFFPKAGERLPQEDSGAGGKQGDGKGGGSEFRQLRRFGGRNEGGASVSARQPAAVRFGDGGKDPDSSQARSRSDAQEGKQRLVFPLAGGPPRPAQRPGVLPPRQDGFSYGGADEAGGLVLPSGPGIRPLDVRVQGFLGLAAGLLLRKGFGRHGVEPRRKSDRGPSARGAERNEEEGGGEDGAGAHAPSLAPPGPVSRRFPKVLSSDKPNGGQGKSASIPP